MPALLGASGVVYVAGSGCGGALGLGKVFGTEFDAAAPEPTHLEGLPEPVAQLSCGWRHSAFVTVSGDVYTCGEGENGKLGHGDAMHSVALPARVPYFPRGTQVVQVSCGQQHTGFVTSDGGAWTCGLGLYGQLGHGGLADEAMPRLVSAKGLPPFSAIACGDLHTLFGSKDGHAYSCGFSQAGRLGQGAGDTDAPACVTPPREVAFDRELSGRKDALATHVVGLSAGAAHSAFLTADGAVRPRVERVPNQPRVKGHSPSGGQRLE